MTVTANKENKISASSQPGLHRRQMILTASDDELSAAINTQYIIDVPMLQ